jgi:hypothetical protein
VSAAGRWQRIGTVHQRRVLHGRGDPMGAPVDHTTPLRRVQSYAATLETRPKRHLRPYDGIIQHQGLPSE